LAKGRINHFIGKNEARLSIDGGVFSHIESRIKMGQKKSLDLVFDARGNIEDQNAYIDLLDTISVIQNTPLFQSLQRDMKIKDKGGVLTISIPLKEMSRISDLVQTLVGFFCSKLGKSIFGCNFLSKLKLQEFGKVDPGYKFFMKASPLSYFAGFVEEWKKEKNTTEGELIHVNVNVDLLKKTSFVSKLFMKNIFPIPILKSIKEILEKLGNIEFAILGKKEKSRFCGRYAGTPKELFKVLKKQFPGEFDIWSESSATLFAPFNITISFSYKNGNVLISARGSCEGAFSGVAPKKTKSLFKFLVEDKEFSMFVEINENTSSSFIRTKGNLLNVDQYIPDIFGSLGRWNTASKTVSSIYSNVRFYKSSDTTLVEGKFRSGQLNDDVMKSMFFMQIIQMGPFLAQYLPLNKRFNGHLGSAKYLSAMRGIKILAKQTDKQKQYLADACLNDYSIACSVAWYPIAFEESAFAYIKKGCMLGDESSCSLLNSTTSRDEKAAPQIAQLGCINGCIFCCHQRFLDMTIGAGQNKERGLFIQNRKQLAPALSECIRSNDSISACTKVIRYLWKNPRRIVHKNVRKKLCEYVAGMKRSDVSVKSIIHNLVKLGACKFE
jgi:hypothetical protein